MALILLFHATTLAQSPDALSLISRNAYRTSLVVHPRRAFSRGVTFPPSGGCQQPAGRPAQPAVSALLFLALVWSCNLTRFFQTNNWIVKGISCHRTVWEGRGGKEEPQPGEPGPSWEAGPACSCPRPPTPGQQGVALEAAVSVVLDAGVGVRREHGMGRGQWSPLSEHPPRRSPGLAD